MRGSAIDFGHFRLRPVLLFFIVRSISTSANFWMLIFGTTEGGSPERPKPRKSGSPEGWRPKPRKSGAPKGGATTISRFLFFFLFSRHLSLLGLFVEFWWCLKRRGLEMCTFGVLFRRTFQGPGFPKHHQNSTKDPMKTVAGEGKKKERNFGGPAEVGPAEVGPAEDCLAQSLGCRIWGLGSVCWDKK